MTAKERAECRKLIAELRGSLIERDEIRRTDIAPKLIPNTYCLRLTVLPTVAVKTDLDYITRLAAIIDNAH